MLQDMASLSNPFQSSRFPTTDAPSEYSDVNQEVAYCSTERLI